MADKNYKIKIGHFFPDLLNLYGDKGNITAMVNRMQWRGMSAEVAEYEINSKISFDELDIVLLGGGSEKEQNVVCEKLKEYKKEFKEFVESGGVVLAVCSGYQMLGKFYKLKEQTIEGLGILDIYTEYSDERLIGNIILQSKICGKDVKVAGFENHSGRTFIGDCTPFGNVISGYGNNSRDAKEGIMYKNVIGTYLHGPLLPKNPEITDFLLERALERRYGENIKLSPLDDTIELEAKDYIIKRFC